MCRERSTRGWNCVSKGMNLEGLVVAFVFGWCSGARLTPLENNDKLQDITNLYVAEWQWESWPIKQDSTGQEGRSPSRRKNVALWKDSSGTAWYLFGGRPVAGDPTKVYSDVWKFTVKTRAWKRLFPSQVDVKGGNANKTGGATPLRANFFDENNAFYFERMPQSVILCGGSWKGNATKPKKPKGWSGLRRKPEEDETEDRLASLAVYAPGTSKSDTVWQIDPRKRLWTAYVCCCDTGSDGNPNGTRDSAKSPAEKVETAESNRTGGRGSDGGPGKNECSAFDSRINKAEDEMENEERHAKTGNPKSKKKKINQTKTGSEKSLYKRLKIEKRGSESVRGKRNETKPEGADGGGNKTTERPNATETRKNTEKANNVNGEGNQTGKPEKAEQSKMASKFCPEFSGGGTPVTWCDGRRDAIITSDISAPVITLWVFNLSTSHWSQLEVKVSDGVDWPACSDMNSVRYAGNGEDVYVVCSRGKTTDRSSEESPDPSRIPSRDNFNEKLVFRINHGEGVLQGLGSIRLNPYFGSPEGERVWQNESQAVLEVIGRSRNETILVLAYLDMVDLWVLGRGDDGREGFHLAEKIWRGSALKWFDKYNAALYSMQLVPESGNSETILLPNPRKIAPNEYWPRERGRFIIRVFRNENLKNQSFENRTREQNLTYELLQSDYKPAGSENQTNHVYSLKVLVFFGISLAIFSVFGIVLFLKRCVNCPPRIPVRNECHKSPMVIRYSVIPDDLLYPVA